MDKFWEWFQKKYEFNYELWQNEAEIKQDKKWKYKIIIGYMIEYIQSHEWWTTQIDEGNFAQDKRRQDLYYRFHRFLLAKDVYLELAEIIKELDG